MALSEVTLTILDGALGIVPASAAKASVKLGVAAGGVPNTLYGFGGLTSMNSTLVAGPALEAAATTLGKAGAPIYVMPVNPSVPGKLSASTTHVGTGAGTVVGAMAPFSTITITCITGGAIGTATFTFAIGTGTASAPILSAAAWSSTGYLVPGTLTVLTFAAATYVATKTDVIGTDGTVTPGSGWVGTVTQASSPADNYEIMIAIVVAGGLGVGQFTYSLDNGNTVSPYVQIPGGGVYAIPGSGIFLTFASTFVANDLYSFDSVTAGFSGSDVTAAMTALGGLQTSFGFVHIVGTAATAAAAASLAAVVQTALDSFESTFRYAFAFVECPTLGTLVVSGGNAIRDTADTDSVVAAAFANVVKIRTSVCAGDADMVSQVTGRIVRRNAAWAISTRAAQVEVGRDLGAVADGALASVTALYRDEFATPALDAARLATLRTYEGLDGFYVSNANMLATTISDFQLVQYRRVMDEACRITRRALLKYLKGNVRVDTKTGFILEQDALAIEKDVNRQLNAGLVAPGQASGASCHLDRSTNILSTSNEPVEVRVTPLGYFEEISVKIGFNNPALA